MKGRNKIRTLFCFLKRHKLVKLVSATNR